MVHNNKSKNIPRKYTLASALLLALALCACGTAAKKVQRVEPVKPPAPAAEETPAGGPLPEKPNAPRYDEEGEVAQAKRPGGYYLDDGPGDNRPPDLDRIPDAVPKAESPHPFANQPYIAFGARYVPATSSKHYKARGVASWYGKRFHGKPTASGEPYDMYKMTAAHPTLPIPSYVRVTNLMNKRSVVVRINDRGPFLAKRLIDLSYAAAHKLGFTERGSAYVEIEVLSPEVQASAVAGKPSEPSASAGNGIFLQLGAFAVESSAQLFRGKMTRELDWLDQAMQVLFKDGLFHVRIGPYKDLDSARNAAQRIERSTQLLPALLAP
jgi:rare lipoprotein A